MVDDAGRTVEILDRWSGEVRAAQVFVAALGASGYPDADVIRSQGLEDWIGSHPRGFETLGGVVEIVVPDHLRSAVTKAHRYDPDLHPINPEMADHDSVAVAVVPARVGKPRDQAPAEWSVLLAERWILASLRNRPFCSLAEVNAEIRGLREKRHRKPFPKLPAPAGNSSSRLTSRPGSHCPGSPTSSPSGSRSPSIRIPKSGTFWRIHSNSGLNRGTRCPVAGSLINRWRFQISSPIEVIVQNARAAFSVAIDR